jgi:RNA polymerase sigma factor (sigma-70 family)
MTAAQTRLVEENVRLAYHVANRWAQGRADDDTIQIACEGLCKAALTFDPTHGTRFSTYAGRVMQNALRMAYRQTHTARRAAVVTSLDAPVGEDGATVADLLGAEDAALEEAEARAVVVPLLARCTDAERAAVDRWMQGASYADIGRTLGTTRFAVRQRVDRAVRRMRRTARA